MRLRNCHNFHDFRRLANRRLPGPIFDYIDGAAEDETTHRRNTKAFESCDLVPRVLRGVEKVDMSVTVMGQKLAMPFYCSPTALQRLFHHQGERAVAAAAARYGTMFGASSLGTVSLEELRQAHDTPQAYQFYFHKDRGLNRAMMQRAKNARFRPDRKSTRLNSSHSQISYAVFCLIKNHNAHSHRRSAAVTR